MYFFILARLLVPKLQPYQIFHDILCDEWNQTIQNKVLVAHIFKMSKMIFSAFWLSPPAMMTVGPSNAWQELEVL